MKCIEGGSRMVTLRFMGSSEFQKYFSSAIENYANEKVLSNNWDQQEAMHKAKQEYEMLLPDREKTNRNYIYNILIEEKIIGMIWLEHKGNDKGFIRDIRILEKYQGKGYGQRAMEQIEIVGRERGVKKMGLHVFGHNKVARSLYEKLGYQTTNVMMIKEI